MTRRINTAGIGFLLGLAMLLGLASQPATAANKVPVNLRVITWEGEIVFDRWLRTGTTRVRPTSSCPSLGGRRGPARVIRGATGIGLLFQAARRFRALRPLRISDSDFGFGICGIGGNMVEGKEWWLLRRNNKDASAGAEGTRLRRGDSVLFYLAESWANRDNPNSLNLRAPRRVRRGATVWVRVFSFSGAGKRYFARGATVFGGVRPVRTNARGLARVTINRRTRLVARQAGQIPSNRKWVRIRKQRRR